MTTKLTKREMFKGVLTVLETTSGDMDTTPEGINPSDYIDMLYDGIANEIALLDKRANAKRGKTAAQKEAEGIKSDILDALEAAGKPVRVRDIAGVVGESSQRVTALLRQMVIAGDVIRTEDKKVAYFTVA